MHDGIPLVRGLLGKTDAAARSYLGKLLKLANEDGQRVIDALHDCGRVRPVCARTWLMQAVRPKRGPKSHSGLAWMDELEGDEGPIVEGSLG